MISIVGLDTPYREPWARSYRSLFTGLLTYEISRSVGAIKRRVPLRKRRPPLRCEVNAGVCATLIMAIIPAHLMRWRARRQT